MLILCHAGRIAGEMNVLLARRWGVFLEVIQTPSHKLVGLCAENRTSRAIESHLVGGL